MKLSTFSLPAVPAFGKQQCSGKWQGEFACFHICDTVDRSFSQAVSTDTDVCITLFSDWLLRKLTEVPSLLETCGKLLEPRYLGTKRKKSKDGCSPGSGEVRIALSPAPVTETIFLTSKLPPQIIWQTSQLESSQQGTPNSGADLLPVSGQPWHACLWNELPCQLYVWLGSCIWRAQCAPDKARGGRGWALTPAPGWVWLRSRAGVRPRCLNQRGLHKLFFKKHCPLIACVWRIRHVSDAFIPSREFVGSWTRTTGLGTWEGFALSAVAYHQSNPVCRLIRLKL